jgi:hypothetical protein
MEPDNRGRYGGAGTFKWIGRLKKSKTNSEKIGRSPEVSQPKNSRPAATIKDLLITEIMGRYN